MEGPEAFWWLVRIVPAVMFLLGLEQGLQGRNNITKTIWAVWISAAVAGFAMWLTAQDKEIVSRAHFGGFTAFAAAAVGLGAGYAIGRLIYKAVRK